MPLDPKIETARRPAKRYLNRKQFIWLTILRFGCTGWMILSGWNLVQSNAAWWAKAACVLPFVVFIRAFAKDNVSG